MKCPTVYRPEFQREGVLHAIEGLASRKLIHSKSKATEASAADPSEPVHTPKRTTAMEPQDAITVRARVIRFKHLSGHAEGKDDHVAARLRSLAETLGLRASSVEELSSAVKEVSRLISGTLRDVSSFEMRQSGMVEALLTFVSSSDYEGMLYISQWMLRPNQQYSIS
jgi:E3 ubiquitin-protein ligase TRIP12